MPSPLFGAPPRASAAPLPFDDEFDGVVEDNEEKQHLDEKNDKPPIPAPIDHIKAVAFPLAFP